MESQEEVSSSTGGENHIFIANTYMALNRLLLEMRVSQAPPVRGPKERRDVLLEI